MYGESIRRRLMYDQWSVIHYRYSSILQFWFHGQRKIKKIWKKKKLMHRRVSRAAVHCCHFWSCINVIFFNHPFEFLTIFVCCTSCLNNLTRLKCTTSCIIQWYAKIRVEEISSFAKKLAKRVKNGYSIAQLREFSSECQTQRPQTILTPKS